MLRRGWEKLNGYGDLTVRGRVAHGNRGRRVDDVIGGWPTAARRGLIPGGRSGGKTALRRRKAIASAIGGCRRRADVALAPWMLVIMLQLATWAAPESVGRGRRSRR